MRKAAARYGLKHLRHWFSLTLVVGVAAVVGHACDDFPSTQCVSCTSTCLDGLECLGGVCVHADRPRECDAAGSAGQAGEATSGGAGTTGAGSDGMGGSTSCASTNLECQATIYTGRELEADCSSPLSIQLEGGCDCGPSGYSASWTMSPELDGITLSPDGELSGEPDPGVYEFKATVKINGGANAKRDFTLTVNGPCRIVLVSDNTDTGFAELRATRLDGSGAETLPSSTLMDGTLSSFDVSPDGTFLARVMESSQGKQLELMRMGRSEIRLEALVYEGDYLTHAFSPDARHLALATHSPGDEMQQLQLVDLTRSIEVVGATSAGFESHLTWAAADWLLFYGASTVVPGLVAAQEVFVSEGEVVDQRERPDAGYAAGTKLDGFLVSAAGYLTLHKPTPIYVARDELAVQRHDPIEALSPNLMWMTHDYAPEGSRVDHVAKAYEDGEVPFGTASHCDLVLAWSFDGSKLLCSSSDRLFVYSTSESREPLDFVELDIPAGFDASTYRMAFSNSGNWLALVPNGAGMLLVRTSDLDASEEPPVLDGPVLDALAGTDQADFFFTSQEDRLVVQWGQKLLVRSLDTADETEFWEANGLVLPPVPPCDRGWFPSPEAWCGAPRFQGNWVVSHDERKLAFADRDRNVQVVDLVTQGVFKAGPLSSSCTASGAFSAQSPRGSRCIQFQ